MIKKCNFKQIRIWNPTTHKEEKSNNCLLGDTNDEYKECNGEDNCILFQTYKSLHDSTTFLKGFEDGKKMTRKKPGDWTIKMKTKK